MSAATRTRKPSLDTVCAEAVPNARAVAEQAAGGEVGPHLGASADAERVVTHRFECLNPAYRGWAWAVTVARASRARTVTVDEVVLLPGEAAVLPPPWVPWTERLRPGDLGAGDVLPTPPDDDRLLPGYTDVEQPEQATLPGPGHGAPEYALLGVEFGLGRARVLSPLGRDDAADRWYSGQAGPDAEIAQAAPGRCLSCGFLLPMAAPLSRAFGVCANEYSPSDGRVVALDHGCGAHSEGETATGEPDAAQPTLDEFDYDLIGGGQATSRAGDASES